MIFRPFFAQYSPPPVQKRANLENTSEREIRTNYPREPTQAFLGFSRRVKYTSLPPLVLESPPKSYVSLATPKQTIKQLTNNPQPLPNETQKKMVWGEPTWFLFHTLAEKVSEEKFSEIRKPLLDIIYTIATNLPCPTCSLHAKSYLDGINFNVIQTKEHLKIMLFDFHNHVNARKQYNIFSYEELSEKYSKAIVINIIHNFMSHFEQKSKSVRLIAEDLHRQRLIVVLKEWFNKYIQYFN